METAAVQGAGTSDLLFRGGVSRYTPTPARMRRRPVVPGRLPCQGVRVSEQDDSAFMKTFGLVMVALTVLAVIIFALALYAGSFGGDEQARAELQRERAERNLRPVGAVHRDGDAAPVELAAANGNGNDEDVVRTGSDVYESVCMACHSQGVMNSPRTGDEDAWTSLYEEKGFDTLVENSINGIRAMPPRGGNPRLSDEEVRNAVVHMLERAGISVDD